MPLKDREAYNRYMRKYRKEHREKIREYHARQKAKIVELKALASKPITITTALELVEKIKEL